MNDLIVVPQTNQWHKLKALVLDSVSSPITRRVYNLGLDEFFEWFGLEPRPGFTKATVSAWRWSPASWADQRADHGCAQTGGRGGRQRTAGAGAGRRDR